MNKKRLFVVVFFALFGAFGHLLSKKDGVMYHDFLKAVGTLEIALKADAFNAQKL